MKRNIVLLLVSLVVLSCAPVLRQDYLDRGSTDFQLSQITETPDAYKGRLFILGGVIITTRNTDKGAIIEAIHIPATSRGYLQTYSQIGGRYLATLPKEGGILEPTVFRQGREITIAGVFTGTQRGRIDEAEYSFPVFEIKDLYLWPEARYDLTPPYSPMYYPYSYPYYSPYPYPWWPDPFFRPIIIIPQQKK